MIRRNSGELMDNSDSSSIRSPGNGEGVYDTLAPALVKKEEDSGNDLLFHFSSRQSKQRPGTEKVIQLPVEADVVMAGDDNLRNTVVAVTQRILYDDDMHLSEEEYETHSVVDAPHHRRTSQSRQGINVESSTPLAMEVDSVYGSPQRKPAGHQQRKPEPEVRLVVSKDADIDESVVVVHSSPRKLLRSEEAEVGLPISANSNEVTVSEAFKPKRKHTRKRHVIAVSSDETGTDYNSKNGMPLLREVIQDIPMKKTRLYEKSALSVILDELQDDVQEEDMEQNESTYEPGDSISSWPLSVIKHSDTVYIQNENGFVPSTRSKVLEFTSLPTKQDNYTIPSRYVTVPIELATLLQKYTRKVYVLCHGLLGGFAMAHFILVLTVGIGDQNFLQFLEMYSNVCHVVRSLFFLLTSLCFISVLDRCDFAHVNPCNFLHLMYYRVSDIVLLIIYLFVLTTTLVAVRWDDHFAMQVYNNGTLWTKPEEAYEEYSSWWKVSLCRSTAAVLGWVVVSLCSADDMLHFNLSSMIKVRQTASSTKQQRY